MENVLAKYSGGDKKKVLAGVLVGLALAVFLVLQADIIHWFVSSMFSEFAVIASSVALFLIPGMAVILIDRSLCKSIADVFYFSIAISLSLYPALFLVSSWFGFRWNAWICWLVIGVCDGIILLYIYRILFRNKTKTDIISFVFLFDRYDIALLFVVAVSLIIRLYVVRDLPAGMFGDSYHHTMIAQLMVDNGGIFSSWQPYAPLKTFTYHFGFHTLIAWLSMLSGVSVSQALLVIGQVENGLTPLVIFAFTKRLTGNARAGVFAALCAGFVSLMPAYYVNWGRYTQLAGQTILPIACIVWMDLIDCAAGENRADIWKRIAFATILTVGVALSHYRVAIFLGSFVGVYSVYCVIRAWKNHHASIRILMWGGIAGIFALAVITPWLFRVHEGTLLRIANNFISKNIGSDEANAIPSIQEIFSQHLKVPLLVLLVFGVGFSVWKRQWPALLLLAWSVLVFFMANPYLFHLNGAGLLTNFAILIALYITISPLSGMGLELFATFAANIRLPKIWVDVIAFLGVLVALHWSLGWQRQIITANTQIITNADLKAMEWIKTHIPSKTNILVNAFPSYGGSMVAGIDGGWWIPLLTQHQTNVPPTMYGSEAAEDPEYLHEIRDMNAHIRELSFGSPDLPAYLHSLGFDYIYDGPTTSGQPSNIPVLISPDMLRHNDSYELLYQQDGVAIWKVR